MVTLQPRVLRQTSEFPFVDITEVPLGTPADASTLVTKNNGVPCPVELKSGDEFIRVVFHTQVTGARLIGFLRLRGWKVDGRHMVMTDLGPDEKLRVRRVKPKDVAEATISPTAHSIEFVSPAGAKG